MMKLMLWKEKELEQYVASNISVLEQTLFASTGNHLDLLGTQIPCMFGKIDMLCTWRNTIFVIEFKAVKADETVIGQVNRYATAINEVANPYDYVPGHLFFTVANQIWFHVQPVVIAPQFDKKAFLSNCLLIQAKRLESGTFELHRATTEQPLLDREHLNKDLETALQPFLLGLVGEAIGQVQSNNMRHVLQVQVSEN